jgi:hypothetical protein
MAYQSHHYSATLLCSACISVFLLASSCAFCSSALSLHVHLRFIFLSQICIFVLSHSSTFYALCTMSILCATPPLCSFAHQFIPPLPTSLSQLPRSPIFSSLFCLIFSRQVLCQIIVTTLHILWQLSTVCSSSVVVILRFLASLAVTVFNTFPSVNCLYDDPSFLWKLSRDSSSPLAITLKLFEFSGRYNQSFLAVTIILFR